MTSKKPEDDCRRLAEEAESILDDANRVTWKTVRHWMESECWQVREVALFVVDATFDLEACPSTTVQVYELTRGAGWNSCKQFLSQGLVHADPEVSSRYDYATTIRALLFKLLEADDSPSRKMATDMREILEAACRNHADEIRNCVVCGILEHMLHWEPAVDFFSEWKNDPLLGQVFQDGYNFANGTF